MTDKLWFCSMCFASEESGSWGEVTSGNYCLNCGAGGCAIEMPRHAVDSIRYNASFVGSRYYPSSEDKESHQELMNLRALPKTFPGRTAEYRPAQDNRPGYWWVTQVMPSGKTVTVTVEDNSIQDGEWNAIEATRYTLPYVPIKPTEVPEVNGGKFQIIRNNKP